MPSTDALYRWSTGLADGRPNPERWTTTIYAAAATWPTEPQFMLVRYADPWHDPEVVWRVATQASELTSEMLNAKHMPSELEKPVQAAVQTLFDTGITRYPRFSSSIQSGSASDALRAIWFEVFRWSHHEVLTQSVQYLLDSEAPLSDAAPRLRALIFGWLSDTFVLNGSMPPTRESALPITKEQDPLWRELSQRWDSVPLPVREAIVTITRHHN